MKRTFFVLIAGLLGMVYLLGATAAETIKIGWIGPLDLPFTHKAP